MEKWWCRDQVAGRSSREWKYSKRKPLKRGARSYETLIGNGRKSVE